METKPVKVGVLRKDIAVIRRDQLMFFDPQADAYFRVSEKAAEIAAYLNEPVELDEFCVKLSRAGIDVSREEVSALLLFLQQNNLLEPEYSQMSFKCRQLEDARKKSRYIRWGAAYMYFRLPPWHPEKFFKKIAPAVSFLASSWFILLLAIPALWGFVLVAKEFYHVRSVFSDTLSWAGAAKYFAAIVLLKVIHEAAHSLAAIRFGCRVRGIGIGFMIFYPRLYTDTTDSWLLPRKERLLIDAAGIIAEVLAGGIAALCYFYLPPGAWKSTMFYIFAVSTISTLLVNGNPCIRYDGYYILCDLTGMDNLMTRSGEYMKACWRYWLLKLGKKPQEKAGWFLFLFGTASFVYRIFLYTAIILVIYHKFIKVLAAVLLLFEVLTVFILPCVREIRTIWMLSKKSAVKARLILFPVVGAVICGFLFLPLKWDMELPGIVVPEKQLQIPLAEGGYLENDMPQFPVRVSAGDTLAVLKSDSLDLAGKKLAALLAVDRCQYALESVDEKDFARSQVTLEKISSDEKSLAELERRIANLTVTAPESGVFKAEKASELRKGKYLPRGMVIGEIYSGKMVIYAYGGDRDIAKLKKGDRARVYAADDIAGYPAAVSAVDQVAVPLKDSPLLQIYGGTVPMYQNGNGSGGFHSVQLYCRVELAFESAQPPFAVGRRVRCEIAHTERLWNILARSVISVFRREL
ncbi:MAG: hypothetical protein E7057_01310 [Lentisphaerae bacterium]|nr:hypothetical protein [Lentisphaerota bacterium]